MKGEPMGRKLDKMVKDEIGKRGSNPLNKLLLSPNQYELLRRRGVSKAKVLEFEETVRKEVIERKGYFFISRAYIKQRVQGLLPEEIDRDYDSTHATR